MTLPEVLRDLDQARRALAEVEIAELEARNRTLRERLMGGDAITSSKHWADIDAEAFTADRLRKRCEVERLQDLRDMHYYSQVG